MTDNTPTPALQLEKLIDTREEQPPIQVAFPGSKTFTVDVRPLGNKRREFQEAAQVVRWDKAHMVPIVTVDQDMFLELFCDWVIAGWSGLTTRELQRLVLIKDPKKAMRLDGEVACDQGAKLLLMRHSVTFKTWINQVCDDVERFNQEREGQATKKH